MRASCLALVLAAGCGSSTDGPVCADPPRAAQPFARFSDVTPDTGIAVDYFTLGFQGGALAIADLDGDALPDLLASPREGSLVAYQNRGGLRFAARPDWLPGAGLVAHGISVADLDNDGDRDVALGAEGTVQVLANAGDGTLSEAARFDSAGTVEHLLAVDLDANGLLDLVASTYDKNGGTAAQNRIFTSNGALAFTPSLLPGESLTWTTAALDIDDDGDLDLHVANDTLEVDLGVPPARPPFWPPDQLLRNDGNGVFTDVAAAYGLAAPRSSMGGLVEDFDGDGTLDLFIPDWGPSKLFIRRGATFANEATALGLDTGRRSNEYCTPDKLSDACVMLTWSGAVDDFDGDGQTDVLLVNGASSPDERPPHQLFTRAGATFVERTPDIACSDARTLLARDLDGDGDNDLVIAPANGPLTVYETRGRPSQWLDVTLRGTTSSRDGIGAVVTVELADGTVRTRAIGTSGIVHGNPPSSAHVVLGDNDTVTTIRVRWPSGAVSGTSGPASGAVTIEEP